MDNEQKNAGILKSDAQYQEETFKTPVVERDIPQGEDLKKVLKPEVLDL